MSALISIPERPKASASLSRRDMEVGCFPSNFSYFLSLLRKKIVGLNKFSGREATTPANFIYQLLSEFRRAGAQLSPYLHLHAVPLFCSPCYQGINSSALLQLAQNAHPTRERKNNRRQLPLSSEPKFSRHNFGIGKQMSSWSDECIIFHRRRAAPFGILAVAVSAVASPNFTQYSRNSSATFTSLIHHRQRHHHFYHRRWKQYFFEALKEIALLGLA